MKKVFEKNNYIFVMKFTGYQILLTVLFIVSGSINTLSAKWMESIIATSADGVLRQFAHPILITDVLFIGEILCMIAFMIISNVLRRKMDGSMEENVITKGSRYYNPLILWPPGVLNMIATSLMLFGIILTNESSFHMLSGSVLIFTAFLSVCIFKRKIKLRLWRKVLMGKVIQCTWVKIKQI